MTGHASSSLLTSLGWDDRRRDEVSDRGLTGEIGRVVRVDRGALSVLGDNGLRRIDVPSSTELVVGDWIVISPDDLTRLERRSELARRVGPHRDRRQSMAANVDLVLIVRALDAAVDVERLLSFAVVAFDSGAEPLVILSKADLVDDPARACARTSSELGGLDCLAVSVTTGLGIDELRARLANRTVVLLGESGAGKSTLTNLLCGVDQLATSDVRRDGQGRHTTTHRELVIIPSGGVVIDTPGIREVESFGDGRGLARTFHDVVALEAQCRFGNCEHGATPGCAVHDALEAGTIDPRRVDLYLQQRQELAWLASRLEEREQTPERRPAPRRSKSRRSDEDD